MIMFLFVVTMALAAITNTRLHVAIDALRERIATPHRTILAALRNTTINAYDTAAVYAALKQSRQWQSATWRQTLFASLASSSSSPTSINNVDGNVSLQCTTVAPDTQLEFLIGAVASLAGITFIDTNCDGVFTEGVDTLPNAKQLAAVQTIDTAALSSDPLFAYVVFPVTITLPSTASVNNAIVTVSALFAPVLVGPLADQNVLNFDGFNAALYSNRGNVQAPVSFFAHNCSDEPLPNLYNANPINVPLGAYLKTGICNSQLAAVTTTKDWADVVAVGYVYLDLNADGFRQASDPLINLADSSTLRLFIAAGDGSGQRLFIAQDSGGRYTFALTQEERIALGAPLSLFIVDTRNTPLGEGIFSNQSALCGAAVPELGALAAPLFENIPATTDSYLRASGTFVPNTQNIMASTSIELFPNAALERSTSNFGLFCLHRTLAKNLTIVPSCGAAILSQNTTFSDTFVLQLTQPAAPLVEDMSMRLLIVANNETANTTESFGFNYTLMIASVDTTFNVSTEIIPITPTNNASAYLDIVINVPTSSTARQLTLNLALVAQPNADGCYGVAGTNLTTTVALWYIDVALPGFTLLSIGGECTHTQAAICNATGHARPPQPTVATTSHTVGTVVLLAAGVLIASSPAVIGLFV